uniref:Uncharacterized protein n=1 Tax=Hippocampus comes TaxID=109280 RepID=A0A3Q2YCD2_HIPCM
SCNASCYSAVLFKSQLFLHTNVSTYTLPTYPSSLPHRFLPTAPPTLSPLPPVLAYDIGFVVCAVIGLLYILVMPIVGSVLACCRFAGKCGAEVYLEQTRSILKERRNLYWSTAIITIFLLAGNICMFKSNWEFRARLDQSQIKLNNTFDNIKAFLRNLDKVFSTMPVWGPLGRWTEPRASGKKTPKRSSLTHESRGDKIHCLIGCCFARWGVCVSMCFVVLLVVLCNVLGLILGPLGLKPTQEPTERSNVANCGGIILITGASLSFLVSWLLMLAVTLLFLLGGNVHTLVCKPWSSGELLKVKCLKCLKQQQKLGRNLKDDVRVCSECGKNKSLWSTLQLEQSYGSEINQYLKIDQVNVDSSHSHQTLTFGDDYVHILKHIFLVHSTSRKSIISTSMSPKSSMQNSKRISKTSRRTIYRYAENVRVCVWVLQRKYSSTKSHLETNKPTVQTLNTFFHQMKVEFGRCGPLAEVVDSAQTILCLYLVSSLNAFWFSLGWCVILFIPSIILSVRLAKHYRRMKYADITK